MESFILNAMCNDCDLLNNGCSGTTNQAWTGCIYKKASAAGQSLAKDVALKRREYIIAENAAYDALVAAGYTPQGIDANFETVCVFKFEHPEFKDHPVKRGACEVYHFKNWQEAKKELCKFRTVKFTAGMLQEFEIVNTDAPDNVILENMHYINEKEERGEEIENPYFIIESNGFTVKVIGCQDNFVNEDLDKMVIDAQFDYYSC